MEPPTKRKRGSSKRPKQMFDFVSRKEPTCEVLVDPQANIKIKKLYEAEPKLTVMGTIDQEFLFSGHLFVTTSNGDNWEIKPEVQHRESDHMLQVMHDSMHILRGFGVGVYGLRLEPVLDPKTFGYKTVGEKDVYIARVFVPHPDTFVLTTGLNQSKQFFSYWDFHPSDTACTTDHDLTGKDGEIMPRSMADQAIQQHGITGKYVRNNDMFIFTHPMFLPPHPLTGQVQSVMMQIYKKFVNVWNEEALVEMASARHAMPFVSIEETPQVSMRITDEMARELDSDISAFVFGRDPRRTAIVSDKDPKTLLMEPSTGPSKEQMLERTKRIVDVMIETDELVLNARKESLEKATINGLTRGEIRYLNPMHGQWSIIPTGLKVAPAPTVTVDLTRSRHLRSEAIHDAAMLLGIPFELVSHDSEFSKGLSGVGRLNAELGVMRQKIRSQRLMIDSLLREMYLQHRIFSFLYKDKDDTIVLMDMLADSPGDTVPDDAILGYPTFTQSPPEFIIKLMELGFLDPKRGQQALLMLGGFPTDKLKRVKPLVVPGPQPQKPLSSSGTKVGGEDNSPDRAKLVVKTEDT